MFLQAEMDSWMGPLIWYIELGDLPIIRAKAAKCIKEASKYMIIARKLYRIGLSTPFL